MKKDDVFRHDQVSACAVLVANLGTPDAPTTAALRRYLRQFLSDRRVIESPRILWWPLLHGIILRTRPKKSAAKYATIWDDQGSPLLTISQRQAAALRSKLDSTFAGPIHIALGMRYGNPSIGSALAQLRQAGARRLLVLPLYPQYSAATTASTFDAVAKELRNWRWLPELRMVNHYHDHPGFIDALAQSIQRARTDSEPGERLLFSFHGLPKRNLLLGDPYHCECHKTARLVAQRLGLEQADDPDKSWAVSFQSRFGRLQWLQPYTSELLQQWARSGVKSVDVVCPGFAADCLETLEEIEHENRAVFLQAGGERYRYIHALNDTAEHIAALAEIVAQHAQGWPEFRLIGDAQDRDAVAQSALTRERALAMGASR